jgi:hypothetical protein
MQGNDPPPQRSDIQHASHLRRHPRKKATHRIYRNHECPQSPHRFDGVGAGLQPDFAEQYPSETSSTRAIYHGSRPYAGSTSSQNSTASRLAALRGRQVYRDQRLEIGGYPQNIEEWQNATAEDAISEDSWPGGLTIDTETTCADEMEEEDEKKETTREQEKGKVGQTEQKV